MYEKFNNALVRLNDYGIIFCGELKKMEDSLKFLYPKLKIDNKNVIEKSFYLNSKKVILYKSLIFIHFILTSINVFKEASILWIFLKKNTA